MVRVSSGSGQDGRTLCGHIYPETSTFKRDAMERSTAASLERNGAGLDPLRKAVGCRPSEREEQRVVYSPPVLPVGRLPGTTRLVASAYVSLYVVL